MPSPTQCYVLLEALGLALIRTGYQRHPARVRQEALPARLRSPCGKLGAATLHSADLKPAVGQ